MKLQNKSKSEHSILTPPEPEAARSVSKKLDLGPMPKDIRPETEAFIHGFALAWYCITGVVPKRLADGEQNMFSAVKELADSLYPPFDPPPVRAKKPEQDSGT